MVDGDTTPIPRRGLHVGQPVDRDRRHVGAAGLRGGARAVSRRRPHAVSRYRRQSCACATERSTSREPTSRRATGISRARVDLARDATGAVPAEGCLRSARVAGQSVQRRDLPAKLTGGAYVHDMTLPAMVYGRVLRPPSRRCEAGDLRRRDDPRAARRCRRRRQRQFRRHLRRTRGAGGRAR